MFDNRHRFRRGFQALQVERLGQRRIVPQIIFREKAPRADITVAAMKAVAGIIGRWAW
jgi:hypothetical protein